MRRRSQYDGARPSAPMLVPPGFDGYVPLDSAAEPGEDVRISALALYIPTLKMVPILAVLERTVIFEDESEDGAIKRQGRRSQIAVLPESVVHGTRVDPEKPWKEWRRYDTREGIADKPAPTAVPARHSPLEKALAFLQLRLANGPVSSREIMAQAELVGVNGMTLRRAKVALGVLSQKHGKGIGGSWDWRLSA